MNSSGIDRRVVLGSLCIVFGVHFLLAAFPQSGYHFGVLVPLSAFVILVGIYGVVSGFHRQVRDMVFWSAMFSFLGIIVLLQVLNVVRFGLTTFAGAAILATGISILTAAMYDSVQGTPSRTSVVWGLGVALIGCLAFMSGLEVFSGQIVDIIRKSTVGVLLLVLGLAVLVRGGERK
ncbi:MAG TPA: hypothetical protein PKH46_06120 [Candidatus Cryosericum sp.]|nr:hypothetical protein [Candidatus Cryosericum sp.]